MAASATGAFHQILIRFGYDQGMSKQNHPKGSLTRLARRFYQDDSLVHWTITNDPRADIPWAGALYYRYRELLTHTLFRYGIVCPIYCCMPDHIHLMWMAVGRGCDQINAMRHFRQRLKDAWTRVGVTIQRQSYDHVLQGEERQDVHFRGTCDYIARNPERAGLVPAGGYRLWKFTGCLLPGYPELKPFDADYWDRLDRIVSHYRRAGFQQTQEVDS